MSNIENRKQGKPGISRRDLFKFGGVAAAGVVGASALSACSPQASSTDSKSGSASTSSSSVSSPAGYCCPSDWLGAAPETGEPSIAVITSPT